MSSANIVNGRDVARDRALLVETKKCVKEALAQRTAALVEKYLASESNSVVDLYLVVSGTMDSFGGAKPRGS